MIVKEGYKNIDFKGSHSVTVGTFDGFHRGHKKIALETLNRAAKKELDSCAVIIESFFDSHRILTTQEEKLYLFKKIGFDKVIVFKKNGSWKDLAARDFIEKFLIDKLNCKYLAVGKDFKFGQNRKGNSVILKKYSPKKFYLDIRPLEKYQGKKISSSDIREQLKKGNLNRVNLLLNRNYFFIGKRVEGRKMGRKIGIPTVNFKIKKNKLLPIGVFGAKAVLRNGKHRNGACFIGPVKVGKNIRKKRAVELNVFNYFPGMEKNIECVQLLMKIRDPKEFGKTSELKTWIEKDILSIKDKLRSNK